MSDNFKIIILAIFNKNDFPNKAMVDIHGKPMLQYIFECAKTSAASDIVIATDSPRVGKGVSRLAEVADKMSWGDDEIIVNFPADAPLITGDVIDQVAENLISKTDVDCATLYERVTREVAEKDETINMVTNNDDQVMYLSHQPIPHQYSDDHKITEFKNHLELNAYRAGLLRIFRNLPESDLDRAENIEELKLLNNGIAIHAVEAGAEMGYRVIAEEHLAKVKFLIEPERKQ